MLSKLISISTLKQIRWVALALTLIFIILSSARYLFTQHQINETETKRLKSWADEIHSLILNNNSLDLAGFYNASYQAPSDFVISSDGYLLDIIEYVPGILPKVELPDDSIYRTPQRITRLGETWRVYGVKIDGGFVVLDIPYSWLDDIAIDDQKLLSNSKIFGSTLDSALKVQTKQVDSLVNFLILDNSGNVRYGYGDFPIKLVQNPFKNISINSPKNQQIGNKHYLLFYEPVLDKAGNNLATIIVPEDITLVDNVLNSQRIFDGILTLISLSVTILLTGYLIKDRILKISEEIKDNIFKSFILSPRPQDLFFDKDKGIIYFRDKEIKIPYATLQYGLCKILFSKPNKKWEYDEILDDIGEGSEKVKDLWKKIYDGVRKINTKTDQNFGFPVILFDHKTFTINQKLPPKAL